MGKEAAVPRGLAPWEAKKIFQLKAAAADESLHQNNPALASERRGAKAYT